MSEPKPAPMTSSAAMALKRKATVRDKIEKVVRVMVMHPEGTKHAGKPDWAATANAYNLAYGGDYGGEALGYAYHRLYKQLQ